MNSALDILGKGQIEMKGEFLWGSNYTFLVQVAYEAETLLAVYKPIRGERPLWDFPPASLAHRETAAYLVSEALGWEFVPPTVYRGEAPLGPGSLQFFVDHDPDYHYFTFSQQDRQRLRLVALFDLLINNADRKGSHILIGSDDRMWLIDHGVCFHIQDKLRTVIWDFAGEPIPEDLSADLDRLQELLRLANVASSDLVVQLGAHLGADEIQALARRAGQLVSTGHFPNPDPDRRQFPWPQI